MTGSISLAATKAKELQVTATIQPPLSPIVPSHGSGLRTVGGLIYLIHAAKWGNNVTNYEQAHSEACGILPFVSFHHVSAGPLGRGGNTRLGSISAAGGQPSAGALHTLGNAAPLGTHSGASSLFGKDSHFNSRKKIEESDTSFFKVARASSMATHCLLPKYQNTYLWIRAINTISFLVRP